MFASAVQASVMVIFPAKASNPETVVCAAGAAAMLQASTVVRAIDPVITGAVLSVTVTVFDPVVVFPAASVTV